MDRTSALNYVLAGSKRLFRNRDITSGIHGTSHDAADRNAVQEELMAAIEGAGITPDPANAAQQWQAIRRAAAAHARTLTASATLTADDAGLVLVNASSGSITVTLPAAAGANGLPLEFVFIRTDSSANSATLQRAGSDLVDGATSVALQTGGRLRLLSDGASAWYTPSIGTSALQAQAGNYALDTGTANAMTAAYVPGLPALSTLVGATFRVKKSASANTAAVTFLGVPVTWPDGAAMAAGDLAGNSFLTLICAGTSFVLQSPGKRPVFLSDFTSSGTGNGVIILPTGDIEQRFSTSFADIGGTLNVSVTFPQTFPSACYSVLATAGVSSGFVVSAMPVTGSTTVSGCVIAISEWTAITQGGGLLYVVARGK